MPQMSPYKWTIILFFMLLMMMLTISFMYFFHFPMLKNSKLLKNSNKWLWKW